MQSGLKYGRMNQHFTIYEVSEFLFNVIRDFGITILRFDLDSTFRKGVAVRIKKWNVPLVHGWHNCISSKCF